MLVVRVSIYTYCFVHVNLWYLIFHFCFIQVGLTVLSLIVTPLVALFAGLCVQLRHDYIMTAPITQLNTPEDFELKYVWLSV